MEQLRRGLIGCDGRPAGQRRFDQPRPGAMIAHLPGAAPGIGVRTGLLAVALAALPGGPFRFQVQHVAGKTEVHLGHVVRPAGLHARQKPRSRGARSIDWWFKVRMTRSLEIIAYSPFLTYTSVARRFKVYILPQLGAKNQMPLFARKKESAVQAFVVSLLNQNCHALQDRLDGPRIEGRVNLTMVVMIVPVEEKIPLVRRAFPAITKEFSTCGVAVVVDRPCGLDEALLGFRWRGGIT